MMSFTARDWFALTSVLLAALALRWVFFTGYFGSDEVTYTEFAHLISQGIWQPSTYIGAVRLGVNLPVGFFLWLFGNTEFVANLWSLLCSLGEIALVFLIARRFWGVRAAVLCALLLAFTPLHAHYAGRLMADAPLGFFITLSFYALFRGDLDASWRWHLVAGLAAGFVWWIKSAVALVYVPVFAVYLIRERSLSVKWVIMGAGFIGMVVLNSLIFWIMQGDFWYLVRLTTSGATEYAQQAEMISAPGYYLYLLLLDIRHTWLLGPLALLGLLLWIWRSRTDDGLTRIAIWGIGLVGLFSLFPVSVSPIVFVTKQVNYLLIFLAPLALLGGYALSRLPSRASFCVAGLIVGVGVIGSALEQLVIRSFVANSKAALAYANVVDRPLYLMTNAFRYNLYTRLFATPSDKATKIHKLKDLESDQSSLASTAPDGSGFIAYAVYDTQAADWGKDDRSFTDPASLPSCWRRVRDLAPLDPGAGAALVAGLVQSGSWLPGGQVLTAKLGDLLHPKPAYVYGIPAACNSNLQ